MLIILTFPGHLVREILEDINMTQQIVLYVTTVIKLKQAVMLMKM